jgi:FkbM family methyltransferase
MKVKPRNRFRNKAAQWLYKAILRLENEGNADHRTNGEAHFVEMLAKEWGGRKRTLFDVGANVGEYTGFACQSATKNGVTLEVHAFEPVADYRGKGTFNKVAVADVDGFSVMYRRVKADGLSSMSRMTWLDRKFGGVEEVKVPTIRLDTYIRKNGIEHIDLLKIDVEGHELGVLKGIGDFLRPDFISYVQFEFGNAAGDAGTRLSYLYEILEARGYKIFKIFPKHLEGAPYTGLFEKAEYVNFVAK